MAKHPSPMRAHEYRLAESRRRERDAERRQARTLKNDLRKNGK